MSSNERKLREFQKREQDILQAALDLLDDEQWDKVTVAQIAAHTDIGKGTVYKHFACKEDIYARILLDDNAVLLSQLRSLVGSGRALPQMRQMLACAFEWHRHNSVAGRLHVYCLQRSFRERISTEYQQRLENMERAYMDLFARVIRQGIAEDDFADVPLSQLFVGMQAAFDGALVTLRNRTEGRFTILDRTVTEEQYIVHMVDYMMASLTILPKLKSVFIE